MQQLLALLQPVLSDQVAAMPEVPLHGVGVIPGAQDGVLPAAAAAAAPQQAPRSAAEEADWKAKIMRELFEGKR